MRRTLTALPVFNEVKSVDLVLDQVLKFSKEVLVVDDGSTDGTSRMLSQRDDILLQSHSSNRGYGAALITAFEYAVTEKYDFIVTIDCDGQHEPQRIPEFVEACSASGVDIVSGSRYLKKFEGDNLPPEQRLKINRKITGLLNERLGFDLTDTFCGFKAYRVDSLAKMKLTEPGYAMPLELWVQAACFGLDVTEVPIPLIYLDEKRSFGGNLDDGDKRLKYYLDVINRSLAALPQGGVDLSSIDVSPCLFQ
ncbi:MAG: glycosyltransferase family 2 protein [Pirellulaceae bacterium]|nr:glycosyltransferase family 2 protein [bacterium]MDG2469486.1 glycosyltransferase family 2 protein [Pirellulaceae bacterium]